MSDRKTLGILGLLVVVCAATAIANPQFLSAYNLQNLIRWTALFGILSIGVSFVIITGGIDLSIGSVVGLVGALLPLLLVGEDWGAGAAVPAVLAVAAFLGFAHGLLVTKLKLQPFVVTLCGLLVYRGLARWITNDQTQGFGDAHEGLRALATGKPVSLALAMAIAGGAAAVGYFPRFMAATRKEVAAPGARTSFLIACAIALGGLAASLGTMPFLAELRAPTPFLILVGLAFLATVLLQETVWGRHLYALGGNEQAARYSGVRTDRLVIAAYVLCSLLAGVGGVLFALDVNSIQPAMHGNFYELYAIAAAVLGGCSLRGGEGTVLGVVIGAAVMRVLHNSINLLEIPSQIEFAIIGTVILLGVVADELLRRVLHARRG